MLYSILRKYCNCYLPVISHFTVMGKTKGVKNFLNIAKYLLPKNTPMIAGLLIKTHIKEKIPYTKSLKEHYQTIKQQNQKTFLLSKQKIGPLPYTTSYRKSDENTQKNCGIKSDQRKNIQLISQFYIIKS